MAENEYLDSTKSRRWLPVADGLREGCNTEELVERVQKAYYKTLRNLCQEIPLADLVASINDPAKLSQLCQNIDGASDVKTLLQEAAEGSNNAVAALEKFLRLGLANCLYDIPYLASERGGDMNLSEARQRLDDVQMRLASDRRRMAEKLAENPSWKPLRQRKEPTIVQAAVDVTRSLLSESLIAGFRK